MEDHLRWGGVADGLGHSYLREMCFPPCSEFAELAGERLFVAVDLSVGCQRVFSLRLVRTQIAFKQRIGVVSLKMALQVILKAGAARGLKAKGRIEKVEI